MRYIVNNCPKAKLLIIGDGPDLNKYKSYVKKQGLEENIIFTGKVPWDSIAEYYLISDVFTTASRTETQGLTVIEAMAASLPVVCIDDESFTNTVIDNLNGKIFKNKRGYKKAIIELYNNPKELKKLSKQARVSAEMHSSKYFVESILDVYKIAIKNKPQTIIPLVDKIKNLIKKDDKDEKDNSSKS